MFARNVHACEMVGAFSTASRTNCTACATYDRQRTHATACCAPRHETEEMQTERREPSPGADAAGVGPVDTLDSASDNSAIAISIGPDERSRVKPSVSSVRAFFAWPDLCGASVVCRGVAAQRWSVACSWWLHVCVLSHAAASSGSVRKCSSLERLRLTPQRLKPLPAGGRGPCRPTVG